MFLQVLNFIKISWFVYQGVRKLYTTNNRHVTCDNFGISISKLLYNSENLVENYKRFCKGDNHRHDPFKSSWKIPYLKVSMHMNLLWGSNMAAYGKTQELSKWHTWVMDRWSFVLRSFPPSHFILLSCICYLQASSSSLVHSNVFKKLLRIGKRALACLVDGHLKIAGLVVFAPKANHVYQCVDKINYGMSPNTRQTF